VSAAGLLVLAVVALLRAGPLFRGSAAGAGALIGLGAYEAGGLVSTVLWAITADGLPLGEVRALLSTLVFPALIVSVGVLAGVAMRGALGRARRPLADRLLWTAVVVFLVAQQFPTSRPFGAGAHVSAFMPVLWPGTMQLHSMMLPVIALVVGVVWFAASRSRLLGGAILASYAGVQVFWLGLSLPQGLLVPETWVPTPAFWAQLWAAGGIAGIGVGWLRSARGNRSDRVEEASVAERGTTAPGGWEGNH
jgi:hypothetical protein